MIGINQLSIHFTGEYIFDNVSFIINDRDRIGLVGKNGAGKTTLLKILAGLMEPEKGNVAYPSGTTIGYLPQEMSIQSKKTVLEEAMKAFENILTIEKNITKYSDELAHISDYGSPVYTKLLEKLNVANEQYKILGGETIHADVERVLHGPGIRKYRTEPQHW